MRKNALSTRFLTLFLAATFALSACQPGAAPAIGAADGPLPLTGANASRLGAAALTLQEQGGLDQFAIVPVLAETGEAVADAKPIELGGEIAYGFSRDRTQMAFLSNRTEGCEKYCLRVMDLIRWEETGLPIPVEKDFSTWFMVPEFDSSSTVLPVIVNRQTDTVSDVALVERSAGVVKARVDLPANVIQATVTAQGDLAVYGIQTLRDGSGPVAYMALLSGTDLSKLWEQTVPEVVFFEGEVDHTDPTKGRYFDPASVFASDGSKLYIVAAHQPLLLTVDFAEKRITSAKIQPRTGWLERLFGVTVAHAKSMNGISMSGVLSPEGRYLTVIGQETQGEKNERGEYTDKRIPLGLQVIDTQDGALLREVDTNAHFVSLGQDGKTVLLSGWTYDDNGGREWVELLDTASWKVTQHIDGYMRPSRLLDGSFALLAVPSGPGETQKINLYRLGDKAPRSQVTHTRYIDWIAIP